MRLSDPALLPGIVGTADETLKARDICRTQEVRAIMASYRSSVGFDYKFLCEKKLLAHIVSTDDNYRLLHPFEIASILGYPAYIIGEALKLPVDRLDQGQLYLGLTSGTAALRIGTHLIYHELSCQILNVASLDLTAAFSAFIDEYLQYVSGQFHLCFESSTCLEGELTKLGIGEVVTNRQSCPQTAQALLQLVHRRIFALCAR